MSEAEKRQLHDEINKSSSKIQKNLKTDKNYLIKFFNPKSDVNKTTLAPKDTEQMKNVIRSKIRLDSDIDKSKNTSILVDADSSDGELKKVEVANLKKTHKRKKLNSRDQIALLAVSPSTKDQLTLVKEDSVKTKKHKKKKRNDDDEPKESFELVQQADEFVRSVKKSKLIEHDRVAVEDTNEESADQIETNEAVTKKRKKKSSRKKGKDRSEGEVESMELLDEDVSSFVRLTKSKEQKVHSATNHEQTNESVDSPRKKKKDKGKETEDSFELLNTYEANEETHQDLSQLFEADANGQIVLFQGDEEDASFSASENKKRRKHLQRFLKRIGMNVPLHTVSYSFSVPKDIKFCKNENDVIYINKKKNNIVKSLCCQDETWAYRCSQRIDQDNFNRYFCNYFDERFDRLCFQDFTNKEDVIDHYFSLHLGVKHNYVCLVNGCRYLCAFYNSVARHLFEDHNIAHQRREHLQPLTYTFTKKLRIKRVDFDWFVFILSLHSLYIVNHLTNFNQFHFYEPFWNQEQIYGSQKFTSNQTSQRRK